MSISSSVSEPAPVPGRRCADPVVASVSIPNGPASTINALFAVSLDLAAVRRMVDESAGSRIERAIEEIDAIIVAVRTGSCELVFDRRTDVAEYGDRFEGGRVRLDC